MNKKYIGILVLIIVIIGIVFVINHKKQTQENTAIVSTNTETNSTEKKVVCEVSEPLETDWCKLSTGQRLLLNMTGDVVYDNGLYYSFSRNKTDQGVRLWKTDNFTCSDHLEMVSCDDSSKLTVTVSGSKDFYNDILKMLKDTYLQTRKDTDPQ